MEVLIELDDTRGAPLDDRGPPPVALSRRWRVALLLVVCTLLGGATAPARLLAQVGPPLPDRSTLLSAGPLLLVVDPGTDPPTVSAYDVAAPGRPARWRVAVPPAVGWSAEAAGDLLLITERDQVRRVTATTARSVRTGRPLWRRPERVYAAGDAAVGVSEVRSASEPGRRVEGEVHGVDPASGATRWSVRVPSTAVLRVLPGSVLLVQDDGLTRLLDARDGTVRGQGLLPPADYSPDNPQVIGGRLVLRHPVGGGVALTGYDLPTVAQRWRMPVERGELTLRPCEGLLCGQDERGRWALDAGSGALVWMWPAGARWRTVAGSRAGNGPLVLFGTAADGERNLIATAGRDGPRVRGVLPAGAADCRSAGARLVCREGIARVTVRPFPPP
ncbi:PQQ-binding-like beta-propeller repeat protein [Micromonospora sp. CPCC 205539]|uniref:outer membrane protein assembly factor BamB family protein n=1 Tax=Micromonospora sp. CPCC 205539 TaxID=3122408 RepID=UPI002FF058D5